ncbi:GntR family transcriptional regulator [Bacillus sp. 522_BSPC]|uniref:GntR family transcriptional regulator n=1 Tax=Bacillus sp. 522_BSPC TaxID=1579338 RepID=UPI00065F8B9F|nr:GntR family transcriptional regulator [Bacillus sp. 522_BSPC]REB74195.1 GntR family transcriptional regulator [Cutibacterium acnes]
MEIKHAQPIYQQVYTKFKELILSGQISPGEKLNMSKLAEQYKISRTPLREALRQLEKERLIVQDENGMRVVNIDKEDFLKLYQCRLLLEKEVVKMVVDTITEENINKMEQILDTLKLAIEERDHLKVLDLNTKFHSALRESCLNEHLIHLLNHVTSLLLIYRANINHKSSFNYEIYEEHVEILEGIKSRDSKIAVNLIEKHLLNDQIRGMSDFI